MATTTNLGITLPTVGGDEDTWGTENNTAINAFDAVYAADGSGTAVGVNIGAAKTLALGGAMSKAAWTTAGIKIKQAAATYTDTSSSGTVADVRINNIGAPTLAASSASTFTNAYGTYFTAPIAGTNVTMTAGWALGADSALINGALKATGHVTFEGVTSTGAAGTGNLVFDTSPNLTGPVGIGMVPVNVLDITKTQNGSSIVQIKNASAGTGAEAYFNVNNGTHSLGIGMAGTGFTPSSFEKADGGYLICSGAGGLTVGTNANQPIYFWVNTGSVGSMTSSEFSMSTNTQVNAGLIVGVPTGAYKGTGTANFAGDIYKNNSAYTNPDYVLEKWATGEIVKFADKEGASSYDGLKPLQEVEAFARTNLHLPRFGQEAGHGLFGGGDAILASLEEAYLYLFEKDKQMDALTRRIAALEAAQH